MKKLMRFLPTTILLAWGVQAFGQQPPPKTAGEGKQPSTQVQVAKGDSAEDLEKFKAESYAQIAENKTQIEKLRTDKSDDTSESRLKYDEKILALEEKNNSLKKRLDDYNETDKTKWASFIREFRKDMEELRRAIKAARLDTIK